jgi:transcriptional regulator with GAF, ATPase, and Fis domain
MTPRLIAVAGPLKGEIFPLAEAELSIGRESSNTLCLEDRTVSRHHCVVRTEGQRSKISDLASANRTYVNSLPVKERLLEHGDEIRIGHSLFVFALEETTRAPEAVSVQFDDEDLATTTIAVLRKQDAVYLKPKKVVATLPERGRIAQNLRILLEMGTAIATVRGLETLGRRLLELIFEVIPAGHGAILLIGKSPDEFTWTFHRDRHGRIEDPIVVSRTVAARVLREEVAILCNNIRDSGDLSASKSLISSQVNSILAVPLVAFEKTLGLIYLASRQQSVRFDEDHLQLATAIAGIAAGAIDSLQQAQRLEGENRSLKAEINIEHNMVGDSPSMRKVHEFIAKVAPTGSTILICGESGTGKELVARAIHRNGPRSGKPFVAINCAALTEPLLESELFGHEKGAFTGAVRQKRGRLEEADGGSVFLDEVGELAPALQAKLLRVLQEREFERVGGTRPIKTDIRLIVATNRDLDEAVRLGEFRDDLYYRLNVVSLTMPPLRQRREDIPGLASYFVEKHSQNARRRVIGISHEARACLLDYDWPGNVRELENAIERAIVLGSTEMILPDDLPDCVVEGGRPGDTGGNNLHDGVREAKKQLILKTLEQTGGSYTEAAKLLGIHPNNLHRLSRTLNLRTPRKD